MKWIATTGRFVWRAALYAAGLALAVAAGFAAQAWWRHPPLSPWHTVALQREFRAGPGAPDSFARYLALETELFAELEREVYARTGGGNPLDRYARGTLPARIAMTTHGNRSRELGHAQPIGAAVMLHGLSDAPYSLDAVGRALHERGFHVVWLRLPGHGTAPSALTRVDWEDWMAATKLALAHAASRAPGKPLYVAGYSTGAPLALLHTLRALDDAALAMPTRLLLFSPAIGVSDFAAMTNFASLLAFVPGLDRARWLDVMPEFDPYKYNSFPVNAGNQIWGLTRALDKALARAHADGRLARMPTVTAFQSLVDSTVVAADLGTRLFGRLSGRDHELVVFDVNRSDYLHGLIGDAPRRAFEEAVDAPALPFRLTVVGNETPRSANVVQWIREPGQRATAPRATGLAWPDGVYSLGHLAIPMPVDDPMYGLAPRPAPDGLAMPLGRGAPRGEAGALVLPTGFFARIRSNPFFAVIVERIDAAVAADR
ncbi:MAG: lysophospholipase [Betaproteobacteria bacterium]|nr:lysophospholipase [Betaproteobacteria bacterium]